MIAKIRIYICQNEQKQASYDDKFFNKNWFLIDIYQFEIKLKNLSLRSDKGASLITIFGII
ncbi:hypothetical protein PT287_02085 [Lactobacillus sp. ESL0679]|uniref:hypothetical protein n=1 Tax=Lactobacillus sp. ESL0679 TaxID=2983209 RepID=UPI0023F72F33|nr:hypothetical protein [Lactobacillus sp. ESL0679]MDF7682312.1 hypothetical protein [Lactobacillus sp. ESL0679]